MTLQSKTTTDVLTAIANPPQISSEHGIWADDRQEVLLARCAQLRILISRLLPVGADSRVSEILRMQGFGPDQLVRDEAKLLGLDPESASVYEGAYSALANELAKAQKQG